VVRGFPSCYRSQTVCWHKSHSEIYDGIPAREKVGGQIDFAMSVLITFNSETGDCRRFGCDEENRPKDSLTQCSKVLVRAPDNPLHQIDRERTTSRVPAVGDAPGPDFRTNLLTLDTRQGVWAVHRVRQPEAVGISGLFGDIKVLTGHDTLCSGQLSSFPSEWETRLRGAMTATYEGLLISIPKRFSRYSKLLLRNQKVAIDRGSVYSVDRPTRTYIVGWLGWMPRMACVQVALPHIAWDDIEKMSCIPMCLVVKDGSVVAGLLLVSIRTCWQLPEKNLEHVDLFSLEDSYRQVLEE
jgi:hypothetical protein